MPLLWFSVCFLVVVSAQEGVPKDCGDIHGDGVQEFRVQGQTYSAPCDQRVDTGGRWTVFQRRFDGSLSFNRTWNEYEHGFGDPSGEVWLGLKWIHLLTSTEEYSLRVDLQDYNGNVGYAVYDHFSVSGPDDNYTLTVSGYHGNIGDAFVPEDPLRPALADTQFSTRDRFHDNSTSVQRWQCKNKLMGRDFGGWWFNACSQANLNKPKYYLRYQGNGGIIWHPWHGNYDPMTRTEMKIRPRVRSYV